MAVVYHHHQQLILLNLQQQYSSTSLPPSRCHKSFPFRYPPPSIYHDVNGLALQQFVKQLIDFCSVEELVQPSFDSKLILSYMMTTMTRDATESAATTVSKRIIHDILRYIHVSDQYMALSSLLFKSWICHEWEYYDKNRNTLSSSFLMDYDTCDSSSMCNDNNTTNSYRHQKYKPKKIMILPRTDRGKPYIPSYRDNRHSSMDISISHQYPFVGLAINTSSPSMKHTQLNTSTHDNTANQQGTTTTATRIGLDIVQFHSHVGVMQRLYNHSWIEFLETYRPYFTVWEWSHIRSGVLSTSSSATTDILTPSILEFYLRWAMKEAYSKALGLGFHVPFHSFEIRLLCLLLKTKEEENDVPRRDLKEDEYISNMLWNYCILTPVEEHQQQQFISFLGRVYHKNDKEEDLNPTIESWIFHFIPLKNKNDERTYNNSDMVTGCACICVPQNENDTAGQLLSSTNFSVSYVTLSQLIDYHILPKK